MKVEYINPFLTSTVSVFQTMLGVSLSRGEIYLKDGVQAPHEVSGIIGLSGKAKGTVVLSFCRDAALKAAGLMLGETPEEVDPDVTDAVGELTNMVAGNAKAQLEHLAMSLSLPSVITGQGHSVEFPRGVVPICIPFNWEAGFMAVEVGLVEVANPD